MGYTDHEIKAHLEFVEWLSVYEEDDRMIDSEDALLKEQSRKHTPRIKTGVLTEFDYVTSGFEPGELVVIGGGTSNGKTLALLTFLSILARNGLNTALFSFELTMRQILQRFGWEPPLFYTPNEISKFREPPIKGLKDCSWYLPNKLEQQNTKWVWLKAWELKCKKDNPVTLNAVFLDHLHFMVQSNGANIAWDIGKVTRGLKTIAIERNLIIFLAVHSTKDMVSGGELNLEDLWGCLPANQKIYTMNGSLSPIGQIEEGTEVLSFRNSRTLQDDKIIRKWPTGKKRIYEVTTHSGRTIRCSDEHKFYAATYNKNKGHKFGPNQGKGIQGWTELKNLAAGQKIAVVREYPDVTCPAMLSADQALVLGWVLGDGHISKSFYPAITVATEQEVTVLREATKSAYDLECKVIKHPGMTWVTLLLSHGEGRRTKDNVLARFLRSRNYCPTGKGKYVLPDIFNQPKKIVASYLRGLFQADGSINLAGECKSMAVITLHTVSERVAKEVKHLLLRFGIVSFLRKQKQTTKWMILGKERSREPYMYTVAIYGQNLIKFMNEIGFLAEKGERARLLLSNWKTKQKPTTSHICFERIRKIEYVGEEETFDVSVRGHHASLINNSFCVEDFITHNSSFISQDADTVLVVWNDKTDKNIQNRFKLKLAKHRYEHGTNAKYFNLVRHGNFLVEEARNDSRQAAYRDQTCKRF